MVVSVELGGMREAFAETDDPNATLISRLDFLLTSEVGGGSVLKSLGSRTMLLNGAELRANSDGTVPALEGEPHAGRTVRVPPLSYGFFVWPEARNAACVTAEQRIEQRRTERAAEKTKNRRKRRKPVAQELEDGNA